MVLDAVCQPIAVGIGAQRVSSPIGFADPGPRVRFDPIEKRVAIRIRIVEDGPHFKLAQVAQAVGIFIENSVCEFIWVEKRMLFFYLVRDAISVVVVERFHDHFLDLPVGKELSFGKRIKCGDEANNNHIPSGEAADFGNTCDQSSCGEVLRIRYKSIAPGQVMASLKPDGVVVSVLGKVGFWNRDKRSAIDVVLKSASIPIACFDAVAMIEADAENGWTFERGGNTDR